MNHPIGLYDSGVGGLSVLRELKKQLPHESIIYLADTARLPYGEKSPEQIKEYALQGAQFLVDQGIKCLIIACHTISAIALTILQKHLSIPVLGIVIPGYQLLNQVIPSGKAAVIATSATVRSGIYPHLAAQHNPQLHIESLACPFLATLIEQGRHKEPLTQLLLRYYLSPLNKQEIKAVLLGCTHYSVLRKEFEKILGPSIQLLEPAEECARQAHQLLTQENLLAENSASAIYQFQVTSNPEQFIKSSSSFFSSDESHSILSPLAQSIFCSFQS